MHMPSEAFSGMRGARRRSWAPLRCASVFGLRGQANIRRLALENPSLPRTLRSRRYMSQCCIRKRRR
jgi:hypothetical protein